MSFQADLEWFRPSVIWMQRAEALFKVMCFFVAAGVLKEIVPCFYWRPPHNYNLWQMIGSHDNLRDLVKIVFLVYFIVPFRWLPYKIHKFVLPLSCVGLALLMAGVLPSISKYYVEPDPLSVMGGLFAICVLLGSMGMVRICRSRYEELIPSFNRFSRKSLLISTLVALGLTALMVYDLAWTWAGIPFLIYLAHISTVMRIATCASIACLMIFWPNRSVDIESMVGVFLLGYVVARWIIEEKRRQFYTLNKGG